MAYYRDIVTEKSWETLQIIRRDYQFVLIGGWAVWIYTKQLKSKDIDLIVDLETLSKLKNNFTVTKNNRLHKYEIIKEEVQVDIYVPFWSQIGIPCEEILTKTQRVEGFRLPPPEALLALKQIAFLARAGSSKGRKDILDIISLLKLPEFNWVRYREFVSLTKQDKQDLPAFLKEILSANTQMPELNLNSHKFSRLKKKWLSCLN